MGRAQRGHKVKKVTQCCTDDRFRAPLSLRADRSRDLQPSTLTCKDADNMTNLVRQSMRVRVCTLQLRE